MGEHSPRRFEPIFAQVRESAPLVNALSIDVEDYFQVLAFEREIGRGDWDRHTLRVDRNVSVLLDLLARHGVSATFFTLGWVARRCPGLVQRIVQAGHEIASHGFWHERVNTLDPKAFAADVRDTKSILEDQSGRRVIGYRAPSFSIGAGNLWALDVLAAEGHAYSSSIYPVHHDLYGMPDGPRFAARDTKCGIVELPGTTIQLGSWRMPCGGGGYFRLLPYPLFRAALRRVNAADRQPAIFYLHPWEIDPAQPRIVGASFKSRFRHYNNLDKTLGRLERLLSDFAWGRVDAVFGLRAS